MFICRWYDNIPGKPKELGWEKPLYTVSTIRYFRKTVDVNILKKNPSCEQIAIYKV